MFAVSLGIVTGLAMPEQSPELWLAMVTDPRSQQTVIGEAWLRFTPEDIRIQLIVPGKARVEVTLDPDPYDPRGRIGTTPDGAWPVPLKAFADQTVFSASRFPDVRHGRFTCSRTITLDARQASITLLRHEQDGCARWCWGSYPLCPN